MPRTLSRTLVALAVTLGLFAPGCASPQRGYAVQTAVVVGTIAGFVLLGAMVDDDSVDPCSREGAGCLPPTTSPPPVDSPSW